MTQADAVTLKLPFLRWKGIRVSRLEANYGLIVMIGAALMLIKPVAISQLSRLEICEALRAHVERNDRGDNITPVDWTARQAARFFCAQATGGSLGEETPAADGDVASEFPADAASAPAPVFSFSKDVHIVTLTTDTSAKDYPQENGAGFLCGATKDAAAIEGRLVAQICPDRTNDKSCIAFFEIADAHLKGFLAQQPGDGADPVAIKTDEAACHPDGTEKESDKK